jgi:hypothetical protein
MTTDTLKSLLARCASCQGVHLRRRLEAEPGRRLTCPRCRAIQRRRPSAKPPVVATSARVH